jgi:hypothetical protein
VKQATCPRDTLSSHVLQADALAFLDRLGVSEPIRRTGAYPMSRTVSRMQDVELTANWPPRAGDVGGVASVRRFVLDPILAEAASQSGAEPRMSVRVTGSIENRDGWP